MHVHVGLRAHTSVCLMMLWILCAAPCSCFTLTGVTISVRFDCALCCGDVCLLVCVCFHRSRSVEIFSFLFLMLRSSCSSYCHCFPIFYCPAFWTRARGSSICTFWKCNNNNNDDDYSDGEKLREECLKGRAEVGERWLLLCDFRAWRCRS